MKDESVKLLTELLSSKILLNKDLYEATHPEENTQKIIEILVENAVNDLAVYGKLRAIEGYQEDSVLDEKQIENLKRKLFLACKIV